MRIDHHINSTNAVISRDDEGSDASSDATFPVETTTRSSPKRRAQSTPKARIGRNEADHSEKEATTSLDKRTRIHSIASHSKRGNCNGNFRSELQQAELAALRQRGLTARRNKSYVESLQNKPIGAAAVDTTAHGTKQKPRCKVSNIWTDALAQQKQKQLSPQPNAKKRISSKLRDSKLLDKKQPFQGYSDQPQMNASYSAAHIAECKENATRNGRAKGQEKKTNSEKSSYSLQRTSVIKRNDARDDSGESAVDRPVKGNARVEDLDGCSDKGSEKCLENPRTSSKEKPVKRHTRGQTQDAHSENNLQKPTDYKKKHRSKSVSEKGSQRAQVRGAAKDQDSEDHAEKTLPKAPDQKRKNRFHSTSGSGETSQKALGVVYGNSKRSGQEVHTENNLDKSSAHEKIARFSSLTFGSQKASDVKAKGSPNGHDPEPHTANSLDISLDQKMKNRSYPIKSSSEKRAMKASVHKKAEGPGADTKPENASEKVLRQKKKTEAHSKISLEKASDNVNIDRQDTRCSLAEKLDKVTFSGMKETNPAKASVDESDLESVFTETSTVVSGYSQTRTGRSSMKEKSKSQASSREPQRKVKRRSSMGSVSVASNTSKSVYSRQSRQSRQSRRGSFGGGAGPSSKSSEPKDIFPAEQKAKPICDKSVRFDESSNVSYENHILHKEEVCELWFDRYHLESFRNDLERLVDSISTQLRKRKEVWCKKITRAYRIGCAAGESDECTNDHGASAFKMMAHALRDLYKETVQLVGIEHLIADEIRTDSNRRRAQVLDLMDKLRDERERRQRLRMPLPLDDATDGDRLFKESCEASFSSRLFAHSVAIARSAGTH